MKKYLKTISYLWTFFIITCCMTGCGAMENPGDVEAKVTSEETIEYTYVPKFHELDMSGTWVNWVSDMVSVGDKVLVVGSGYDSGQFSTITAVDVETGEAEAYDIGLGEERYVNGIASTDEGFVVFSEEYAKEDEDSYKPALWQGAYLTYYDADFKFISETNITDVMARLTGYDTLYYDCMAADKDGNTYFCYNGKIYVIDNTGVQVAKIALNGAVAEDMALVRNQVVLLYKDKSNTYAVAPVDRANKCMGEPLKNIPDFGNVYMAMLFAGEDDILHFATTDSLFAYNLDTAEYEEVLEWMDCDMSGSGMHHCITAGDKFICGSYNNRVFEITVLNKVNKADVKEKKNLTLTMIGKDYYVMGQVLEFNRRSEECRIETKFYTESDAPDDLEAAALQFNLDLITGDVGDIILVPSSIDFKNLASKGAFAGLDEFMEQDPEIDKADLIENIVNLLSVDGKLYGIDGDFTINTLVGKTANVGTADSWNVADVLKVMEENPDSTLVYGMTKENGLRTFLSYSMDSYLDPETGECNFNSDEFMNLLKITAEFPDTLEDFYFDASDYINDVRLLEQIYFSDVYAHQMYRALFGGDVNMIGYPVNSGSGSVAVFGNSLYAISASSEKKEAAWQFVRQCLLEEYQEDIYAWPINKNVFEKRLTSAVVEEPEISGYSYNDVEVKVEKLTEEDAEYIRKLVYGITKSDSCDAAIMSIILEEAKSYYAGQKSVDEVAGIIQNRVQLYVDENS